MPRWGDDEAGSAVRYATFRRIMPFFRGHARAIVFSIVSVLFATALTSSLPLVFRHLVDKSIPSGSTLEIYRVGIFYLVLLVLSGFTNYFQSLFVGYMGLEIVNDIKKKMMRHILSLSIRFFDKNPPGRLISRIESDSQKLFTLFSTIGLQLLGAFLNILIAISVMLITNVRLTLFVLAVIPIYSFGVWIVFRKMRPMFRKDRELYARIIGFLGEHLKAVPLLRNLNNIEWSREKFLRINEEKRKYELRIFFLEQLTWFFLTLAPQLAVAAILYQSVNWIGAGIITIGTVWMFTQYIDMAIQPLIQISEQIGEIQRSFGAADRIFEILDTRPEVAEVENPVSACRFEHEIRFEHVDFHYDPDKPVLRDVSFTIPKGSTLAIVGPTGSGKTTIISLLTRFYDPTGGRITIDGHDLRELRLGELRGMMSLVLQDIFLFPGNLIDNLRVLRRDIPEQKVIEAAKSMGIEPYIERFPRGYLTEISEEGGNLSFGERQLLSFSRAMTFDPQILIMDEATSSVDPYTEAEIQISLMELLRDRTAIIIAHRLSTIRHARKIIVIDGGRVIEEGTHAELLALDGAYARLYNTQMGTAKPEVSV